MLLFLFFSGPVPAQSNSLQSDSVTIGFVGDIMMHNSQLRRAWLGMDDEGNDQGYDFSPSFEWFADYLESPDFTIGNFETTLGGPNSAWIKDEKLAFREYHAYPCFTTPDELAADLADAGFDLIGTANNHAVDSRITGVTRTLNVLSAAGLSATGTAAAGKPEPWRGNIGGFNLSILAWTHSVNGLIARQGMEAVNVFNATGHDDRLQDMLDDIAAEAAAGPDLVILFIHWGQEYMNEPDQYQKNLAQLAINAGADVIIGSHPHHIQPIETRIVDRDGDGPKQPREVFIAWSLGNFISSQRYIEGSRDWVDGSAMLNLMLDRDAAGRARISAATMIPLYVKWSSDAIRVLAVRDGLVPGGIKKYGLSDYDMERLKAFDEWIPIQMTRYLGARPARRWVVGWRVEFPEP